MKRVKTFPYIICLAVTLSLQFTLLLFTEFSSLSLLLSSSSLLDWSCFVHINSESACHSKAVSFLFFILEGLGAWGTVCWRASHISSSLSEVQKMLSWVFMSSKWLYSSYCHTHKKKKKRRKKILKYLDSLSPD